MNKRKDIKFGTEEVISIIITTALYVIMDWVQQYLVMAGILSASSYDYFKFRVLIITLVAVIYGPILGVVVAIGGTLLVNVAFYGYISYAEVGVYVIDAIVLGCCSDTLGVLNGRFTRRKVVDFNMLQMVINIFCSMFMAPFFLFLTEGMNLNEAVNRGAKSAVGNIIGTGIFGTIILIITNSIVKHKFPERATWGIALDKQMSDNKPLEFDERVRTMYKERL